MNADRRTAGYTTRSLAPVVLVAAAASLLLGPPGLVAVMILALPWFAWRYDNHSGAFFVLALLSVIVVAVLALLIMLMAIAH